MKMQPIASNLSRIVPNKLFSLEAPDSVFESQLGLLYTFLNTREGELVYSKDFGIN